MDYTSYLNGLLAIAQSYSNVGGTDSNFEIQIKQVSYSKDPLTGRVKVNSQTGVEIIRGKIRQVTPPYSERTSTQNSDRIYIEGNLLTQQYIDIYTPEFIECQWKQDNVVNSGLFFPEKLINNSVAQGGRVDYALGQKIKGFFELKK